MESVVQVSLTVPVHIRGLSTVWKLSVTGSKKGGYGKIEMKEGLNFIRISNTRGYILWMVGISHHVFAYLAASMMTMTTFLNPGFVQHFSPLVSLQALAAGSSTRVRRNPRVNRYIPAA